MWYHQCCGFGPIFTGFGSGSPTLAVAYCNLYFIKAWLSSLSNINALLPIIYFHAEISRQNFPPILPAKFFREVRLVCWCRMFWSYSVDCRGSLVICPGSATKKYRQYGLENGGNRGESKYRFYGKYRMDSLSAYSGTHVAERCFEFRVRISAKQICCGIIGISRRYYL